ncbi:MAG TPA: hypothetical protein VN577_07575 [Terriglobales bacterium]|nr:hypothetical protein [Terriglobales bacterium]
MRMNIFVTPALVIAFTLSAFGAQTKLTGVLTDDMCTKKHMMPGKPNGDCVRECIKHGAKYVIVSDGKAIPVQGKEDQLSGLAGKKVIVSGELKGKTLVVTAVEPQP